MKETLKNVRIAALLLSLTCYVLVLALSANQNTTQDSKDAISHVVENKK